MTLNLFYITQKVLTTDEMLDESEIDKYTIMQEEKEDKFKTLMLSLPPQLCETIRDMKDGTPRQNYTRVVRCLAPAGSFQVYFQRSFGRFPPTDTDMWQQRIS